MRLLVGGYSGYFLRRNLVLTSAVRCFRTKWHREALKTLGWHHGSSTETCYDFLFHHFLRLPRGFRCTGIGRKSFLTRSGYGYAEQLWSLENITRASIKIAVGRKWERVNHPFKNYVIKYEYLASFTHTLQYRRTKYPNVVLEINYSFYKLITTRAFVGKHVGSPSLWHLHTVHKQNHLTGPLASKLTVTGY